MKAWTRYRITPRLQVRWLKWRNNQLATSMEIHIIYEAKAGMTAAPLLNKEQALHLQELLRQFVKEKK